jgi:hypothetical protein
MPRWPLPVLAPRLVAHFEVVHELLHGAALDHTP